MKGNYELRITSYELGNSANRRFAGYRKEEEV